MKDPKAILKHYWGYDAFRPLQEDIISAILTRRDVLALLPTGGGKSICYQIPALASEGLCLVISPLVALMKDQTEQLRKRGILASAVFSGMRASEIDAALDNCIYGGYKFLYLSPERIKTELFLERAHKMPVSLIAVDEAHCISQWGYDFRPSYLELHRLRELFPAVNVAAFTASATEEVKKDICEKLQFKKASVFTQSFFRPNISYSVRRCENKEQKLLQILHAVPGSALVYVRNRKKTEETASFLKKNGISAAFYHAGMASEERAKIQDDWIADRIRVVAATNAFGMGIDKPDVRTVVHLDLPDSPEAYYQEAGRAGRDGYKSYAVIIFHESDILSLKERFQKSHPDPAFIRKIYKSMTAYLGVGVGEKTGAYPINFPDFVQKFRLEKSHAYYALKKLEQQNLIQLSQSDFRYSLVKIISTRQATTDLLKEESNTSDVLRALLRLYGGVLFTEPTRISESDAARLCRKNTIDVIALLKTMHKLGLIDYKNISEDTEVTFLNSVYSGSALPINVKQLKYFEQADERRCETMVNYVLNRSVCRSVLLARYFGEYEGVSCGVCDCCIERKNKSEENPFDNFERVLAELKAMLHDDCGADVYKMIGQLPEQKKKIFLKGIRYLLDSGKLIREKNGRFHLL